MRAGTPAAIARPWLPGIRAAAATGLATALLEGRGPAGGPRWTTSGESPIAVCSAPYSPRRVPLALGITPDQARALATALGGGSGA
ncbi:MULTISPECIES: hypothetical protein [Streptomyces]|uniref:hypothetical protein n=1 Tax=Streptomyces TaxID=1883 RepID=UPI00093A286C|nr:MULTISPECIES: hypothetical protein [Streptomyces]MBX9421922.1 hypothetical protein [Streptomyces lateritius]OKJ65887.1 hypothetical protein AMK29_14135 [Streptomyces sp. CB02261]